MPRDYRDLLADILSSARAIERNASELGYEEFSADENRVKAVLYDLAVIGEACRSIPDEIRAKRPTVEWGKIVGLRNFIAHVYWTIRIDKIWEIVRSDVPELAKQIESLITELDSENDENK
jgi:uncharacterized protein with HEPN domain